MGYQEREQKVFQGLYNTRQGTGAPAWGADDTVNIDFRRQSIRGRGPTTRVWSDALPAQATYHDGKKVAVKSSYAADAFSLNALSAAANTGFVVRAYLSGINLNRLQEEQVYSGSSIYWHICGSTGASTDFGAGVAGQTDGWALSLEQYGVGTFRFRLDARLENDSSAESNLFQTSSVLSISETDDVCLEWVWTPDDTTSTFRYYLNGSNSITATTDGSLSNQHVYIDTSASYYMTIGAFLYGGTSEYYKYNFDGYIGQVEIHKTDTVNTDPETRWFSYAEGDIPTRVYFLSQPEGSEYQWSALGNNSYTNTGAGEMVIYPAMTYKSGNNVVFPPGNTGYITAINTSLEGVKNWGWILGVAVNAPPSSDEGYIFPPWVLTDDDNNVVVTVNAGTDPNTQYKLRVSVSMFDDRAAVGVVSTPLTLITSDISYGSGVRLAFFLQTTPEGYGTGTASTLRAFISTDGGSTYAQVETDQTGAYVHNVNTLDASLGGYDGDDRTISFTLTDVRGYSGLTTFPSNSAEVVAIDVTPGTKVYPNGLAISLDGTMDVATTTVGSYSGVQRWRDSRNDYVYVLFPNVQGRRYYAGIGNMTGPKQASVLGVHDFNIQAGMEQTLQSAVIMPGGVYVRDISAGTGQFYVAPMYGAANATSAVQYNDRLIISGNKMRPFKVYPGGTDTVGLQRPLVGIITETSSDEGGDLAASTTYRYKFSLYNSLTGDESNLNPEGEAAATSASHDTLTLGVGIISKVNTDWDFLMVYRQAQGSNTYYLEQRVPRPTYWQNVLSGSPPLTVISQLRETDLLLQQTESIDNYPPGDFSTSAIGGRVMHFGGAGTNPGYVYYSKTLLPQSAPPLNVWTLNNDNSDRVIVIRPLFGRIVILKQRSIWTARDDAAVSGEQPANVHVGKGCVNPKAAAVAGNSLFFLSPDRVVYVTDGFEVNDVSSQSILGTLESLTEAQMSNAQMTHDAPDQRIWLSIPPSGEGARNLILTFDYNIGRWSKWEMPHDVIDSGQDSSGLGQQRPLIGSRGHVYEIESSFDNRESDAGSGQTDFSNTYAAAEYITSSSKCVGFASTFGWDSSVIGMPAMVVFHSSATYTETTDPIWDNPRLYTFVRGVKVSGGSTSLYLGHPLTSSGTHATIIVGTQFRRYLPHWFSPQGVGFDYLFSGWTFIPDQDVVPTSNDTVFRVWFDEESTPTYSRGASEYASSSLVPDLSYSMRKRGRRIRYEILSGRTRNNQLEIQRAIIRYRIRGPRRRK